MWNWGASEGRNTRQSFTFKNFLKWIWMKQFRWVDLFIRPNYYIYMRLEINLLWFVYVRHIFTPELYMSNNTVRFILIDRTCRIRKRFSFRYKLRKWYDMIASAVKLSCFLDFKFPRNDSWRLAETIPDAWQQANNLLLIFSVCVKYLRVFASWNHWSFKILN